MSDTHPEIWLCGTSPRAAALAGSLGVSFAYHHHLANPDQAISRSVGETYRDAFEAREGGRPRFAVAAYGHCAPSEEQAASEWRAYFGADPPRPSFIGAPSSVAARLKDLALGYAADELLIDCFVPTLERRLEALAAVKAAVDGELGPSAE